MTSVRAQAEALSDRLTSSPGQSTSLADAAIQCAHELIEAGDSRVALDLLSRLDISSAGTRRSKIQLAISRALLVSGRFEEGLQTARLGLADGDNVPVWDEDSCGLEIVTAICLRETNRITESEGVLRSLRSGLLRKSDSKNLAWCTHALAAARHMAGDLAEARQLAIDALVSARRSGSRYFEVHSLLTLSWLRFCLRTVASRKLRPTRHGRRGWEGTADAPLRAHG